MSRALLALAVLALAVAACDTEFVPVEPGGPAFSLSGVLDASADTQWVRVEPIRDTFEGVEGRISAMVTLIGPDGRSRNLTQRVRTFPNGPAHLFYTTADIEQGATYEIVVRDPEGAESRAAVSVPRLSDAVEVNVSDAIIPFTPPPCPVGIEAVGYGEAYVVDIEMLYTVRQGEEGPVLLRKTVPQRPLIREADRTAVSLFFGDDAPGLRVNSDGGVWASGRARVSFSDETWPRFETLEDVLFWRGAVENGLGFVGGVVTVEAPVNLIGGTIPTVGDGAPFQACTS